jgi:hypothetical protein
VIDGYINMMRLNHYEIAILRILLKSASTLKISEIVYGFPDDLQEEARLAISNLVGLGYLSTVETPNGEAYASLNKEKRREVLDIVSPRMISPDNNMGEEEEEEEEEEEAEQQQKPSTAATTTTTRSASQLLPASFSSSSTMTTLMLVGIIGVCAAAVTIISVFAIYQISSSSSSSHQMIPATMVEPPSSSSRDVELMAEGPPPISIVRENGTSIEEARDLGEVIPATISAGAAAVVAVVVDVINS